MNFKNNLNTHPLDPYIRYYNSETGYERGGRRCETWWRQTAAQKRLREMLEDISVAPRSKLRESSRRGNGRGGEEIADSGREGTWHAGMETGEAWVGG